MDEKLETSASLETDTVPAATARSLDLNELQELSSEELEGLARDLDLYLHPGRSRHQHILDIIRAALSGGASVTA